jgi:hypothetical protein
MVPHMVAIIVIFALVFASPPLRWQMSVQKKACINVYTDNNQIIIEARKGTTTAKKSISQAPKKQRSNPHQNQVSGLCSFRLQLLNQVLKAGHKAHHKPRIKKVTTKVNLSDRLTKLVPTAGVAYQPEFEPLINVPVYFWCDLPSLFQSRVDIIGEVVDVVLRPSFYMELW